MLKIRKQHKLFEDDNQNQQGQQQNNNQQPQQGDNNQQGNNNQEAWNTFVQNTIKTINGTLQGAAQAVPGLKESQDVQNAFKVFQEAATNNNIDGMCDGMKQFFTACQQCVSGNQESQEGQQNQQQNNNQQPQQNQNQQPQQNQQQNESFKETFTEILFEDIMLSKLKNY